MSEYVPSILPLGMGIDVSTPKLAAEKGSLLSCNNYEITDTLGLSRVSGYEAYDGQISGANEALYVLTFDEPTTLSAGDLLGLRSIEYKVGSTTTNLIIIDVSGDFIGLTASLSDFLAWDEDIVLSYPPGTVDTANVIIIGKVVEVINSKTVLTSVTNYDLLYNGAKLADLHDLLVEYTLASFVPYITWAKDTGVSVDASYSKLRSSATFLRSTIGGLNGVVGLHWFKDTLYAVAPSSLDPTKGTLWKAMSEQQVADEGLGTVNPALLGWQEIDLGVDGTSIPHVLPLFAELSEAKSRYQFITHNFYGADSLGAFYGVNGVGRAFSYDGTVFKFIEAIPEADLDKPRHIAVHEFRLVLGYIQGSVMFSVIGEPTDFDPLLGAAELAVGDRVTGLQSLIGEYLGIFCQTSVKAFSGDPTGTNPQLKFVSPNTGCLEYSLVNVGDPVYCNSFGIVSLETTDAYGDFSGIPLSFKISPIIKPRMKSTTGRFNVSNALLGVFPVRSKNQYRFVFKDGFIITMTKAGKQDPEFTTRQYDLFPYCWSSEYDENGEEQIHMADLNPSDNTSTGYVYSVDKGWGFNGRTFDSSFSINPLVGDNPFAFSGIMKTRLHGLTRGLASLKVQVVGNQEDYDFSYSQRLQALAMPRVPTWYGANLFPSTDIVDLADRGLMISLLISSNNASQTEPPHTCQALMLLSKPSTKIDV